MGNDSNFKGFYYENKIEDSDKNLNNQLDL